MSEVQSLTIKEGDREYEIYVESKTAPQMMTTGEVEGLPTVNIDEFHQQIRTYTSFILGAFKEAKMPGVEQVTLRFGLKLNAKMGIPVLVEGSAEGNFEIEVRCNLG
jgi:hypothetical protein